MFFKALFNLENIYINWSKIGGSEANIIQLLHFRLVSLEVDIFKELDSITENEFIRRVVIFDIQNGPSHVI